MKKYILFVFLFLFPVMSYAAISYSEILNLNPGWNIVSTPRVLESHSFSLPETSNNFDIFVLNASSTSGWSTLSELGQTQFTPLFGYFINNKSTSTQTLTLNYKASTTPDERFFERSFTKTGWYSFGIANPTYSKKITDFVSDTNNPSKILSSLSGSYDSVIDLINNSSQNLNNFIVSNTWKQSIFSDIDELNDFRDNNGYAVYITQSDSLYSGFQNDDLPQPSVVINANGNSNSVSVSASSSVEISWSSINTSSCIVSPEDWSGISGEQDVIVSTTTTYFISCSGTYGGVATSSVDVNISLTGSVTIQKDLSLSDHDVVTGSSNITLARYIIRANVKDMKISYLQVASTDQLDNVALYANGVQIGSTQTITATTTMDDITSTSTSNKLYNLGSSLIIPAGSSVILEIRGDIKYNGINAVTTDNTIQVALVGYINNTQDSYYQTLSTNPDNPILGQIMRVVGVGLTVEKNNSFDDSVVELNTPNVKIGSYVLQANSVEGIRITSLSVMLNSVIDPSIMLSNLYINIDGVSYTPIGNPKYTNNFSVDFVVPAGGSKIVDIYADTLDINSSRVISEFSVYGYGIGSNSSVYIQNIEGQAINLGTDSISPAVTLLKSYNYMTLGTGNLGSIVIARLTINPDSTTPIGLIRLPIMISASAGATTTGEIIIKNGDTIITSDNFEPISSSSSTTNIITFTGIDGYQISTSTTFDIYTSVGFSNDTRYSPSLTTHILPEDFIWSDINMGGSESGSILTGDSINDFPTNSVSVRAY